jgi:ribosome biogenesis GTPase / thiamine phosphate phosphatase
LLPDASREALVPYGWSDRVLALFNDHASPHTEPARVVRVERGHCLVVDGGAEQLVTAVDAHAVGDWVAIADGAVRDVLPRWSALTRQDPGGAGVQVLAANIDLVLVTAPADRLSLARVERELAVAWESGARPVVALTKADLAPPGQVDELRERLVGADVITTSAVTGEGVEQVRAALQPDRTAVLLGPSGAGKSTLANQLLGEEILATGDVREDDRRGRHTTTSRQLVTVPGGGVLIDTPGLRSLGLAGDGGGVEQAFADITELAGACRFGDCAHETEPGCAVLAALEGGDLDANRFESYRKLEREIAAEQRKVDPVARKEEVRVWKQRNKAMRARQKPRS